MLIEPTSPSPDGSGKPAGVKTEFLKVNMATNGSQCEIYKNGLNDEDLQRTAGTAANII